MQFSAGRRGTDVNGNKFALSLPPRLDVLYGRPGLGP